MLVTPGSERVKTFCSCFVNVIKWQGRKFNRSLKQIVFKASKQNKTKQITDIRNIILCRLERLSSLSGYEPYNFLDKQCNFCSWALKSNASRKVTQSRA